MKKIFTPLLLCLLSFTATAQEVVSVENQGITLAFALNFALPITVDYNVQNYKLTYTTTDPAGMPDTATGLFCVPLVEDLTLPLVIYNHGTIAAPNLAPSVVGVLERAIPQAFAASGFIGIAPDYLGLGDSDGPHPYLHAATEASAGRDMILAVKSWLATEGVTINDQLFTTGYSQGGHASMALHRDIQTNPGTDGLVITAAAHLSGAYQIAPPSPLLLGARDLPSVSLSFFLNTVIGYNYAYNFYGDEDQLFNEPYLAQVERFLANEIDLYAMGDTVRSLMLENNALLGEVFSEAFVGDVLNDDPTLLNAWAENTVSDFAPTAPTLLYYCNADMTVSPQQSLFADSVMTVAGADSLYLEDGGALDHGACAIPAAVRALEFFQSYPLAYPVSLGTPVSRPEIVLAPNPVLAGAELRISGLPSIESPYAIHDFSGRVVADGLTGSGGSLRLPAALKAGAFVVRVGLGDGTSVVRRFVVR